MTSYAETIRHFIVHEMVSPNSSMLSDSDSLIERGIIDSLGVQVLVVYLEKQFGVHIVDEEIIPENFETIGSVANLINMKLSAGA